MRKYTWLLALGAAAVIWAAQGGGLLSGFAKSLNDAQTLKVAFSAGTVGGNMANFDIALAKPDKARIETPSQIVIANGKTVLTYDKGSKTFFRDPQNAGSIKALMQGQGMMLWAPFFDGKALDKVSTKSLGQKPMRGTSYNVVEATYPGGTKTNFYLDASGIARAATTSYPDTTDQALVLTKNVTLGGAADASLFAFSPPTGSRELSEEERFAGKWLHNLDEALELARKTNRLVMVDFDATWCGPCQKMKAEVYPLDEFKAFSKQFVFCEIDVDDNKALAAQYKATSIPAVHFLRPDGSEVHKFVGYSNPQQVLGEMKKALQLAGK